MNHASIARHPADQRSESERNAYNTAFHELGLEWHWDTDTFATLQAYSSPGERIRRYVETAHPHLLRAYDSEFLAQAIETQKNRLPESRRGYR